MRDADPRVFIEPSILAKKNFWIWIALIALLAFALRSYDISNRPFHNDEAVNFFFIQQTEAKGYFPYSHQNYHGPSYFYLTKVFTDIFGFSDYSMRFSAILCGMLLIPLLLIKRREEGDLSIILASLFTAISSSLVFYSRYAIHESLFLLVSSSLAFLLFEWTINKNVKAIFLGAISLALLVATKETFIISLFCLGLAYLSLGNIVGHLKLFVKHRHLIFAALSISIVMIVAFFTGGFKWFDGLYEMVLAVPQWVGRNDADYGHHKPFWYYSKIILAAEPQLLFSLICPLLLLIVYDLKFIRELRTREALWIRFVSVWGFSGWLVYSFVKYKTPWLIINFTFPLTIASAWWLALFIRKAKKFFKTGMLFIIVALVLGGWSTFYYVFEKPYGPGNPYSYVHTNPGFLEMMDLIKEYRSKYPSAKILVAQTGYWPFPYYIREDANNVAYIGTKEPERFADEYDVIILDHTVKWDPAGFAKRYFRTSDVGEAHIFFKRR